MNAILQTSGALAEDGPTMTAVPPRYRNGYRKVCCKEAKSPSAANRVLLHVMRRPGKRLETHSLTPFDPRSNVRRLATTGIRRIVGGLMDGLPFLDAHPYPWYPARQEAEKWYSR